MISLLEREASRQAIVRLTALLESIEVGMARGEKLPANVAFLLGQLTKSDAIDTQRNVIDDWLDDTKAEYREKLRIAAPDSLSCFAEFLNPDEYPAPHHEWMCAQLELVAKRQLLRLMISMPPGHGKSVYCTHLFPAWYMGKNPDHKYIQAGHTQDFVDEEFGKKVRGIINSDDYHEVFSEIRLDPGSKAASRFALAHHKGKYLGRGVGQGISGFRAHIAAVDDPFASRADAESATIRNAVYNWFMADFTTRLLPRSPLFIVATRWHTDDLCGRLEEKNNKNIGLPWKVVNFPAIAESDNDPLGRREGEALWANFFTLDHLTELRATLPPRDWNSLYMGKPMDAVGGAFQVEWIKRYENYPTNDTNDSGNVTRLHIRRVTVSVDSASKTNERNDYTVITVWIEDTLRNHYLVDVIRKRLEFPDLCSEIDDVCARWNKKLIGSKIAAILVEDKGSGTQYIQTHRAKAPAPVIAIEVGQTSKEFRFDGVLPMFEAGEVLLPTAAGWLPDYEREMLSFPTGAHDDQVDSTSQYLAWARKRQVGGTKKLSGVGRAQQEVPSPAMAGTSRTGRPGGFQRGRVRSGDFAGAHQRTPSVTIGG